MDERSRITIEFSLDRDIESAANDVRDRVSRVAQQSAGRSRAAARSRRSTRPPSPIMWLNLSSDTRSQLELTDYAAALSRRSLLGRQGRRARSASAASAATRCASGSTARRSRRASSRCRTSRTRCARRTSSCPPAASSRSRARVHAAHRHRPAHAEDFRQLVVGRGEGGYLVRLGEVADVELAAEDLRNVGALRRQAGVSLGIVPQSTANVLEVADGVQGRDGASAGIAARRTSSSSITIDDSVFVQRIDQRSDPRAGDRAAAGARSSSTCSSARCARRSFRR